MPAKPDHNDILYRLNRLLITTPEDVLAAPPISRRTLAAAVAEIKRLRTRVAELETQRAEPQQPDQKR